MPTNNASGTFIGTGFTIPVTVCNLDSDITIADFLPFIGGTPVSTTLFTKTSPTVLTYIGTSLAVSTAIIIQRRTPNTTRTGLVTFASRFSSDAWNKEIDRTVRHSEEYALNGIGPGSVVISPVPQDVAYPTGWLGDTTFSATRNALYNILSTLSPLASPTFTGNPVVPTQALNDNTTKIANTAFVINQLAGYATLGSPSFTGNPTVLTQVTSDNSTKIANTAFVQNNLVLYAPIASPTFTGTPTIPGATLGFTQNIGDATSHLATTAFVSFNLLVVLLLSTFTQSIAGTSTYAQLTSLPAMTLDRLTIVNASAGTFTPTVTGYYRILASLLGATSAASTFSFISLFQGATLVGELSGQATAAGGFPELVVSQVVKLVASTSYNFKVSSTTSFVCSKFAFSIEFIST